MVKLATPIPKVFIGTNGLSTYKVSLNKEGNYDFKGEGFSYSGTYDVDEVELMLSGSFSIVEIIEPHTLPNGVDKDGNPLSMGIEDLKPFQRVEVRNGIKYIVVPTPESCIYDKPFHLVREDENHNSANFQETGCEWDDDYIIDTVFEAPNRASKMLSPQEHGGVVWQRKNSALLIRQKHLQEQIDEVNARLETLKQQLAELA